jgi:hypothetical protein
MRWLANGYEMMYLMWLFGERRNVAVAFCVWPAVSFVSHDCYSFGPVLRTPIAQRSGLMGRGFRGRLDGVVRACMLLTIVWCGELRFR